MGGKLLKYPYYTIILLLFFLFAAFPVIYTIGSAFFSDSLLKNLSLFDKNTFFLLLKSCFIALSVAFLSTFFGTVSGFLLYKTNIRFRAFFKTALLIPLFISPYILSVAWKDFFYLFFENTSLLSSLFGVIFIQTIIYMPLSMLIIGSASVNISSQPEESGFMITNFRNVIIKIVLPLIKPAIITSFVLVFIFSISEFSVPAFLNVKVFTTEIFTQFSAFYNHSFAVLQSVFLIIICILLLLSERKYIADAPFFSVGTKGMKTKIYSVKKYNALFQLFMFFCLFLSVIFPFIIIFLQSFKSGTGQFIQAFELLLPAFGNSVILAFFGALTVVFIGFSSAFADKKIRKYFDFILLFVFALPSTILGISLIKFYNLPFLDFIYSGFAIIIIAYAGKFSFISAKLIGNAVKQIPGSLDESAEIQGVSLFKRMIKIHIPLILPSLFIAFIIIFIFCLGELGTTIMLYPPGTEILPIKVFTLSANASQSLTSSMTLIVFALTLIIISGFYFVMKTLMKKNYG